MRRSTLRRRCAHLACYEMVIFAFGLRGLIRNVLQLVSSGCVRHGPADSKQDGDTVRNSDRKAFDSLVDGRN